MSMMRAVRYRRLALVETDAEKARVLQLIAEEADRGVLFTAEWLIKPTSLQAQSLPNKQTDGTK